MPSIEVPPSFDQPEAAPEMQYDFTGGNLAYNEDW